MPSIEHLENQHIEILQSQDDTTCGVENDGPCIGNSLTESIVITKGNSSERTVVKQEEKIEENNEERENTHEDIQEKQLAEDCCGMTCEAEQKPQGRSDSSDNNYSDIAVNITIPCCRKRKCPKTKKCATGHTCTYLDSCCYSDAPAAVIDNVKLKQENKALKNCIKRVRACAVNDACELIKSIMGGCKCSCCMARTKLRPCKSVTCECYPLREFLQEIIVVVTI
ncbi:hypothetical protein RRG08_026314 [Elysia crispata]|uniref:Uncharacterized protein n=1 Tax=Elysia crispata TaxID=231223 RepID=A0AAE0ZAJ7_9GAST|nr:hypothetical protein RRG08_026314 [Elysia crispata]